MKFIEEYEKELAGRFVSIVVRHDRGKPFPYYAISSLNVDGYGKTLEEAKMKCENATKMEITMNR